MWPLIRDPFEFFAALRSSSDPNYLHGIQDQARDLITDNHAVLGFYEPDAVLAASNATTAEVTNAQRSGLERLPDLATWLDLYSPTLKLS